LIEYFLQVIKNLLSNIVSYILYLLPMLTLFMILYEHLK
jgi:hypothetical protein